ncbi:hypothetical protein E1I18_00090 [Mycoplasmopsis mucosicanis]|uniref:Lipoprotein n=1 Tax=Mycoplasmopsis mucosicanis TaxID=458208 RepID=A0A507SVE1_9BACT|nr:hypothetical protein [Mycoplasmopsis mucosicanis]TQC54164.1 hypothetical protein E1I18_00090 [Mycoplasmopsis mucosicanis]
MKKLSLLASVFAFSPVVMTASCFLDGTFVEKEGEWRLNELEGLENYKSIKPGSVHIEYKNQTSQEFRHKTLLPKIKDIETEIENTGASKDLVNKINNFIKRNFVIKLTALRPHKGWDTKNSYSHIHEEQLNDISKPSTKVLAFQMLLTTQPKIVFGYENGKLYFEASFASKNVDQDNTSKPQYYFKQMFEIEI